MKKLALLLAVLSLPLVAGAQGYFKDGMRWESCLSAVMVPPVEPAFETFMLDGDTLVGGVKAMKMYVENDKTPGRELVAVVRTDGDRVLFRNGAVTE